MVALTIEEAARWRRVRAHPHLRIVEPDVLPLVRRDTLPDNAGYRDTGCELFRSCLRCPLARCQYDEPPNRRRGLLLDARDREIAMLRRRYDAPISLLASTYGLTRRTIFRILSEQRAKSKGDER